jgi:hypothetical protein
MSRQRKWRVAIGLAILVIVIAILGATGNGG